MIDFETQIKGKTDKEILGIIKAGLDAEDEKRRKAGLTMEMLFEVAEKVRKLRPTLRVRDLERAQSFLKAEDLAFFNLEVSDTVPANMAIIFDEDQMFGWINFDTLQAYMFTPEQREKNAFRTQGGL